MTMAQGGLFNGDAKANELFAFAANGKSQSKEAKYHRAYRSDPKNKGRINSQKKRRRALKREKEMGNVSSMFESAARPGKEEQQTVEKVLNKSDRSSLPDIEGEVSGELNDSSRNYCQEEQIISAVSNFLAEKSSSSENQRQARLFEEIRDSFRGLRSELKLLRDEVKATAPVLSKINNTEQQASVSRIAITNGGNVTQEAEGNQAKISCSDKAIDDNVNKGKSNFFSGFFLQLSQIDGAAFVRNFPAALVLGFCAYHACLFVAEQTVPLYESLQFPNPQMACYGAIGIAVGFSALSAISRTEIIKLFTAVIITYEVLIVWSGSQANQKKLSFEAMKSNPTHFSISETYGIAKTDYEQKKARYEDKNSEVYHNGWFKINHLDPAKSKMDKASAKLVAVETDLGERYQTDWVHLVLKALYRLSAIALVMLLAKETIKRWAGVLSF